MRFNDRAADRQAHAHTVCLGGIKRGTQFLDGAPLQSGTIIGHINAQETITDLMYGHLDTIS